MNRDQTGIEFRQKNLLADLRYSESAFCIPKRSEAAKMGNDEEFIALPSGPLGSPSSAEAERR
jgi:hypothetical protein